MIPEMLTRYGMKITFCLFFAGGLMAEKPSSVKEVELFFMDVPPMTVFNSERKGIVGEAALEILKEAGLKEKLTYFPSPRALSTILETENTLIIPVARIKSRENQFTWILPIVTVKRAFFTLDQKINDFATAKKSLKSIGVSRGTANYTILLEQGFSREQIVELNQGETAPRMLVSKRIDAWYNLVSESKSLLRQIQSPVTVLMGSPLGESPQYLAGSKKIDPGLVKKLTDAFQKMRSEGRLEKIMKRYPEFTDDSFGLE